VPMILLVMFARAAVRMMPPDMSAVAMVQTIPAANQP
jgi:hypothetical protein